MQPQHNYVPRAVAALTLMALLAGCHTTTQTTEKTTDKKATTEPKEEYVRTTQTGSWIPKKVKKKDAPSKDSAVTEVNPESLEKLNESGRSMGTRGLSPTQ